MLPVILLYIYIDPYFQIRYKPLNGNNELTMYRSEVIMKNLNPKWTAWELDLEEIGGLDVDFKIQVFDWDKDGTHGKLP